MTKQVFNFRGSIGTTTNYMNPIDGTITGTAQISNQVMPANGKVGNCFIRLASFAPAAGQFYDFEIWKNNALTGAFVTLFEGDRTGIISKWVDVVAGDKIEIKIFKFGAANQAVEGYIVFHSTTPNQSLLCGSILASLSTTGLTTEYIPMIGATAATKSVLNEAEILIPTAGTLKRLFIKIGTSAGSAFRDFAVMVNGSPFLTATVSPGNTTASNVFSTKAVVAGDKVCFRALTRADPPTINGSTRVTLGVVFEPTNAGEYIVPSFPTATLPSSGNRHAYLYSGTLNSWGTFAQRKKQRGDVDYLNLYARVLTAPGAGTSRVFILRKGFSTAMSLTITAGATTGSVSSTVRTQEQGDMDIRAQIGVGSPAVTLATMSCTAKFIDDTSGVLAHPF